MESALNRVKKYFLILFLTVGVVCSCCSCAIAKSAVVPMDSADDGFIYDVGFMGKELSSQFVDTLCLENTEDISYTFLKGYSNFLDNAFSENVVTNYDWISALIEKLDIKMVQSDNTYEYVKDLNYYDGSEYFITAAENGIINMFRTSFDQYDPLKRGFLAATLAKACGYDTLYTLDCADFYLINNYYEVASCLELGFLELDSNNCFNPEAYVTKDEFENLLSELDKISVLKGKTVLTFGDSIMYGEGNDGKGIADLLAEKYMMKPIDYSVSGATFGYSETNNRISNQIFLALRDGVSADVVLIDGGTNDMRKVPLGKISEDYEYGMYGRSEFCSGMEYALGLLCDNYPQAGVVYIRPHNMEFSLERNELHYAKTALDICEKWEIPVVDIFSDTELNTHDEDMKNKYTKHTKKCIHGDSVHPNQLGYYKYYIPLVSSKITEILETE